MEHKFYIYALFRPCGEVCYIGKGKGRRFVRHCRSSRNSNLDRIIQGAGGSIPAVIIRTGLSEIQAFEAEIALIKAIGRKVDGGPLVNLRNGGQGTSGYLLPRDPEWSSKMTAAIKLAKATPEARAAQSAQSKLNFQNPAVKEKHRASLLKVGATAEYREKRAAGRRGKTQSPEARAKISAAMKERMNRPEYKAKIAESNRRRAKANQDAR